MILPITALSSQLFLMIRYWPLIIFNLILIVTPITTIQNYLLYETVGLEFLLAYQFFHHFRQALPVLPCREPSLVFLVLYFIFVVLSLSWSSFHPFSTIMLITQSATLFGFGLAYFWNSDYCRIQQQAFILIGLGFALSTHYHVFFKDEMGNFFGNPNTYAAFMALLVTPLYCLFLNRALEKKSLYLSGGLIFILSLATGFIYSRGGLLTLIIDLGLLSLVFLWHKQVTTATALLKLFGILILIPPLVYLVFSTNIEANNFTEGKILAEGFKSTGQGGRGGIWAAGWRMFWDNPILGWGLGTFKILFPQYKDGLNLEAGYFAHNDYLQILVELGVFGFLLFIGFVFSLVIVCFKAAKQADTAEKRQNLSYAIACIGMLAHSFFDFNWYRLPTMLLMGFYLGLFFRAQPQAQQRFFLSERFSTKQYYTGVSLLASIVFICLGSFGLFLHFMDKADLAKTEDEKLEIIKTANLFYSHSGDYELFQSVYWMNRLFEADRKALGEEKINAAGKEILTFLDTASRKNPREADFYFKKAQVLIFVQPKDNQQAILENFTLALKMNPDSFVIRSQYANYLASQQQYKQCLDVLWGVWQRVYHYDNYQEMHDYLGIMLHYNQLYGNSKDNAKILAMQEQVTKYLSGQKSHIDVIFQ